MWGSSMVADVGEAVMSWFVSASGAVVQGGGIGTGCAC